MAVKWEKYLSRVSPEVKGCPAPIVIQAIRDAAKEFCQKTYVWSEIVECEIDKGSREAWVEVPYGSSIVAVINDERKVEKFPYRIVLRSERNPITLEKEASDDKIVKIRVALKPEEGISEGPDFLYNDHAEAISHGAKARLMYDARKSWGHPELAFVHHNAFRQAIAQEKIRISQGYVGKGNRVKFRRFS